jgi:hypothetical protein
MPWARRPSIFLLAALAFSLGACQSTPEAGPCEAVFRFENVRKDSASAGQDEWADIARVLRRYARKPLPPPRTSNARSLPGGEVRTCEVAVALGSAGDLGRIEAELQRLASQHSAERRLDFNLERAQMLYRSNFVAADLEVRLRGVTQPGFDVGIFTSPGRKAAGTVAGRSGAWTVRLPTVPEHRYVYGYSQDPEGRVRTRFFKIDVSQMQQETVTREEFIDSVGVDPDRMRAEAARRKPDDRTPPSSREARRPPRDRDEDW